MLHGKFNLPSEHQIRAKRSLQALDNANELIGVVVCKLEPHRSGPLRGYIAMLAVRETHRGKGIATKLVCMAIDAMAARDADEIVLETEVTNQASLKLYERLGFLRSKRLHRYYLNGNAAYRLVLYMKEGTAFKRPLGMETGLEGQMMGEPPKMEEYIGFAGNVGVVGGQASGV